jgi:hypothetical protein
VAILPIEEFTVAVSQGGAVETWHSKLGYDRTRSEKQNRESCHIASNMTSIRRDTTSLSPARAAVLPVACPCQNFLPGANSHQACAATLPASSSRRTAQVLCTDCVKLRLGALHERRRRILQERDEAREGCRLQLAQSAVGPLLDLQEKVQLWRARAQVLRQTCAQRAVDVARQSCENDERRQEIETAQHALLVRPYLSRLQASLLDENDGSLTHALHRGRQQVRLLRFEWAKRAFAMHRLDVCIPADSSARGSSAGNKHRPKIAKGIGRIAGLPLPHAGPELYGVLPPQELESALRLVASVTSLVASCLGIVLPHPILLQTAAPANHDLATDLPDSSTPVDPVTELHQASPKNASGTGLPSLVASTASLAHLMGQTAKKVWNAGGGGNFASSTSNRKKNPLLLEDTAQSLVVPPSMDTAIVQERICHASAAILAEDMSLQSSRYSLAAAVTSEDQYAIALQLLQNDIVILCIRAGVPVARLWPAQAVLLNLQALHEFCKEHRQEGLLCI